MIQALGLVKRFGEFTAVGVVTPRQGAVHDRDLRLDVTLISGNYGHQ